MPHLPSHRSTLTEACRVTHPPRRLRRTPSAPRPLALALALAALPGALLVAVPLHAAAAQQPAAGTGRVAGTVLGEGNRPVPGAQVVVVGTRLGAVSDENGRYTIAGVPGGAQTVRVQRIGFAPRTQPVTVPAGQVATLDFTLTASVTELSTVAVVGYTQEARRDISGAVASVSGNELRQQQVATVEEALRGRAPGVQVSASGQPGRPAQIIIRGQNGFNSPNPLYVVDGNYIGQQNPNLNPDDIASLEILKDASAAAQYGAQASNGVIVITTRRGQAGATQFSLNSYYGFQQVPNRLDLASTDRLLGLFQQAYANAGTRRNDQALVVRARDSAGTVANTDWQDAVFRTGAIQNYNLQASGGSTSANYLISGSVFDQDGTVLNTNFRRYSVRVNSEARRGRVTVGEAIALSQARQTDFGNGIFGGQALPLIDLATLPSAVPVRDANNPGGYGFGSDAIPAFQVNPVAVLERNSNRRRSNQVIGTGYGEVRLFGGLRYRANLGLNYADSLATVYTSATQVRYRTQILPVAPGLPGNNLFQATPTATNLLWENLLNYDGDFGRGKHRVSAVAGQTSQRNQYNQQTAFRQGFITDQQQLNAGSNVGFSNTGFTIPFRTNSLLSRATYAYSDRYLLTGSVRRDCSSRFSPGNRCGTFGAGSVGWVASEEGFFRTSRPRGPTSSAARASPGVLGDQNIGDLRYFVPSRRTSTTRTPAAGGTSGGSPAARPYADREHRPAAGSATGRTDFGLDRRPPRQHAHLHGRLLLEPGRPGARATSRCPLVLGSESNPAVTPARSRTRLRARPAAPRERGAVPHEHGAQRAPPRPTAWCRSAPGSPSAAASARCRRPSSASRSARSGCAARRASSRARPTCRTGRTPAAR
jgi:TonB-linked SusC/RagA family outer membrane protein